MSADDATSLLPENKMLQMGTKVIAVRVGPEKDYTDFTVHETLIRNSSPYFEDRLNKHRVVSGERMVRLHTCEAAAFQLYVQWLYTGRLYVSTPVVDRLQGEGMKLFRGYLLGEILADVEFQDAIIDAILQWTPQFDEYWKQFIFDSVKDVYGLLKEGSPFHKLLVDLAIWKTSDGWWAAVAHAFPTQFVRDVSIKLFPDYLRSASPFTNKCAYHGHEGKLCYDAIQASISEKGPPTKQRVLKPAAPKKRIEYNF